MSSDMSTLRVASDYSMQITRTNGERCHDSCRSLSGMRQFPPGGSTVRGRSLKTWIHAPGQAKSRSSRGVRAPAMLKRPPAPNRQESRTRTRLSPFFSPESAERQGLISEEMGTTRTGMGAFLTQMAAFPTGMGGVPSGCQALPSGCEASPSRPERSNLDGNDPHLKGSLSHRDGRLPHLDPNGPSRRGSSVIWMGVFPTWMERRPSGAE